MTGVDGSSNKKDIIISSELVIAIVNLSICSVLGKEIFDGP
jgi:hypothetical protein